MKKVIIVGGGIIGAAAAFELTKRKYDVTIIDSEEKVRATSAAAGIICPWISQRRNKTWYELASKGAAFLEQFISDLNEHGKYETGYKKVGAIRIHTDRERLEKIKELAIKRRVTAPQIGDITLLSKEETKEKFPLLANNFYSLYVSGAARVDGRALRESLTEVALELGATYVNGKAELLVEGNEVTGVKVDSESIFADYVILTNGIWMPDMLSPFDITLNVLAQKGEIVHLHTDTYETNHLPVVMAPYDKYILSFDDGRIVAGATRDDNFKNMKLTAGGLHDVLKHALEVAPELSHSTIIETRVGMRPFTPNHLPVFGPIPSLNRLLIANGLGSSGLTTGPFIGSQLVKMIANEEPDIDWKLYRVEQALE